MEELGALRNEVQHLGSSQKQIENYSSLMAQSLTHLYGAFLEGQLLAYVFTEGNDTFRAFSTRAGVRKNSFSPQEFLDLSVTGEFARRGVQLFDRGVYNVRKGIVGLTKYKRKFGPLVVRREVDYYNAAVRNSPELRYLQDNFKVEV